MAHQPHHNSPADPRHQQGWNAFMKYSGYATAAVIFILILMAIFLT